MKKWIAFCLTFVLVMSMCLGAHAATQEEILGVWDVDMVNAYMVDGYTEEEARVLVAQPNAISTTVEFRADGKFITTQYVAGTVVGQGEGGYSLTGQLIVVDGVGAAQLVVEGNTLKFIELNGLVSLIATRQAAANPEDALIGRWLLDYEEMLVSRGFTASELEAHRAEIDATTITMEFTADGRWISLQTGPSGTMREEEPYTILNGVLYVGVNVMDFSIEGDCLTFTMVDNGIVMHLYRMN